jgi:excinuclease ABC subunit B
MRRAMDETDRRRTRQVAFNEANGITPRTVVKRVKDLIDGVYSEKAGQEAERLAQASQQRQRVEDMSEKDVAREIKRLEKQMMEHARDLEFEKAARVRDELAQLKRIAFGAAGDDSQAATPKA